MSPGRARGDRGASPRARYLRRRPDGRARRAGTSMSEPRVRCVNVDGLVRTGRTAIIEYLGIESGEVFTAEALARIEPPAGRPVASRRRTRVRFDPAPDGTTTITPIVDGARMFPKRRYRLGRRGAAGRVQQELRVRDREPVAATARCGRRRTAGRPNRPRAMLRFDAPAPGRLPGMVSCRGAGRASDLRLPGARRRVPPIALPRSAAPLSDWVTSWLRWEGGTGLRPHRRASRDVALEGSLNARALGDRLALIASAGYWLGAAPARSFGDAASSWPLRGRPRHRTCRSSPPGRHRRRHRHRAAGGVAGGQFRRKPRRLAARASAAQRRHDHRRGLRPDAASSRPPSTEHPFHTRFGTVALAGFVDAAQALRRLDGTASPFHVDVGTGVRLNALGAGAIRTDFGYGLRDGRVRVSAGYDQAWGTR